MGAQPVIAFVQRTHLLMGDDHKVNMKMDYMTNQADHGSFIICFFLSNTQLAISLLMERALQCLSLCGILSSEEIFIECFSQTLNNL